ncbi:MAG: ABC transporter permease [Bacteroidaceae bacterium]|nr:ABC transporter permease [Bacteroidaceae bacterium]
MIKKILRQALTMMKQHRLFTSIYIAGTALSVTMIMITFAVLYIKFAPIYPEENRERTLIIKDISFKEKDGDQWIQRNCSPKLATIIKGNCKHLDEVCCTGGGYTAFTTPVTTIDNKKRLKLPAKYVDAPFWRIYNFDFIDGRPFNDEEEKSLSPMVVISRSLAMELFADSKVAGQQIIINGNNYIVAGVVEDVTSITPNTSASMYMPMSLKPEENVYLDKEHATNTLLGSCKIYATAKSASEREALKKEIENVIERINESNEKYTHRIESIDTHIEHIYGKDALRKFLTEIVIMIAAFLLIPALNLGNMIFSRMENRMVEFGVSKAYGATNKSIALQILCENMILTLIGGTLGLLLSIAIVNCTEEWIIHLYDTSELISQDMYYRRMMGTPQLPVASLFNVPLFIATLLLCMVINIVSAFIPLVAALRHSIVYSLNKRK